MKNKNLKIDLSIIPTHECNLQCWFCMYNSSPDNKNRLNYDLTEKFFKTIDWDIINSIGFYGGEISINMELYQNFINLIPKIFQNLQSQTVRGQLKYLQHLSF